MPLGQSGESKWDMDSLVMTGREGEKEFVTCHCNIQLLIGLPQNDAYTYLKETSLDRFMNFTGF